MSSGAANEALEIIEDDILPQIKELRRRLDNIENSIADKRELLALHPSLKEAWNNYQLILKLMEDYECDKNRKPIVKTRKQRAKRRTKK